jgi:hypothetical protein
MRFHVILSLGVLCIVSGPLSSRAQFQPISKDELTMVSDSAAPGASAVYLDREETEDDPHAFRTVYARIKVLTEAGKAAAIVHIDYPQTFVFNASGSNSSRMSSGLGGTSTQGSIGPSNSAHWDAPSMNHVGEDMPWDTDSYVGKVEVGVLEGRVVHPDGTVVQLTGKPADLLKVTKGPRGLETSFIMPGVNVGSVIEYRYQIRYDRYLTAPDWNLQTPYFIHKEHFVFRPSTQFSPGMHSATGVADSALKDPHDNILTDIQLEPNLPAGKNLIKDALGNYVIDLTDVPPIPQELWAPPLNQQTYHVDFFYTYTPDVKDFWQKQMGFWTRALNRYIENGSTLQNAVKENVSPTDSQLDKARKLYALVQKIENTDFNSDGAPLTGSEWIPKGKVESVLLSRKDSSNEIAYLYLGLVRAAGIRARPERIASRSLRLFSAQYMNNIQLDTVLVQLSIDGKEILVDPGTKMAPFRTLHWAHAGAGGVAMDAGNKVEIIVTPLQKNSDNSILHAGNLNVSPKGTASGTLKVAFTGERAIELRQVGVKSGVEAVKSEIDRMIAQEVPEGISAKVDHVAYLDDPSKQLLAVIPVSGLLAKSADGQLVLPRLFFETKETNPFPVGITRKLPVDMRYPAQEQEQITYMLPPGFTLKENPQDTNLKWEDNAAYQLRTKIAGDSITNARILVRGFTMLEAKDYDHLYDFYRKVIAADQQQLVLSASQASKLQ